MTRVSLALLLACLASPAVVHAHADHHHDEVLLSVAQDGSELVVELHAPGVALVGFERPPRDAREQGALTSAVTTLKQPAAWLIPDADARCVVESASVKQEGFGAAGPAQGSAHDGHDSHGHAEIRATYRYRCGAPSRLENLDIRLAQRYPRIKRLRVELVLPDRQEQRSLSGTSTRLVLRP
jgi:hypothetical protein